MIQTENGTPRNERTVNYNGIKFFKGNPLPERHVMARMYREVTANQLRDEMKVWRPEETVEAAQLFFEHGKVNVVGEPQSGKGTILFGLSEICQKEGWGYVFIDGHHQEVPYGIVTDALRAAQQMRVAVFFDSFDYLFMGSSRHRTISHAVQEERTGEIVQAAANLSVPIAITTHDEGWAQEFVNTELREKHRGEIDSFPIYEIPLDFMSYESIRRFLQDSGFSEQSALFLIGMHEDPKVINLLTNFYGDKSKVQEVFGAIQNYPVLKELTRDRREDVDPILFAAGRGNVEKTVELARIIREAEHKRRFLTLLRKTKDNKKKKHD